MTDRILPDWLEGYLRYTDQTEQPFAFRLWSGISALASALERKCFLRWTMGQIFPNFYIVLIGVPGGARKSTSLSTARSILEQVGVNISANATTKEALVRRMKGCFVEAYNPATELTEQHCSLTIHSSELAAFFHRRDDLGLISWMCEWFDCDDLFEYETVSREKDSIPCVYLNLIGGMTTDHLGLVFPKEVVGTGLTTRMIFVYSDKPKRMKHFIEPDKELFNVLVNDLEVINSYSGEFITTPEYKEAWGEWYVSEHAPDEIKAVPELTHYLDRRQVHLHKLAMVISASESSKMQITLSHFERAREILEYTERRMPYAFAQYNQEEHYLMFKQICLYIELAEEEGITWKQLVGEFYQDYDATELNRAISTLTMMEPSPIKMTEKETGNPRLTWIGKKTEGSLNGEDKISNFLPRVQRSD